MGCMFVCVNGGVCLYVSMGVHVCTCEWAVHFMYVKMGYMIVCICEWGVCLYVYVNAGVGFVCMC